MGRRIAIIQGHPDPAGGCFGHALADAYAEGAISARHKVERVDVATIEFPLLRTKADFEDGAVLGSLESAQQAIGRSDHLVILFPLWLGSMPALLKGFLEQVMRPGFAIGRSGEGLRSGGLLRGKSARVIVTMGMPAFIFKWYFGAHGLKSLERNILGFAGISPIRRTVIGGVEGSPARRRKWLDRIGELGRHGA